MDRKDRTLPPTKRPWVAPTLVLAGTVGEILNNGGGKLSTTGGDPGEMRCQKGINPHPCS